MKKFLKFCLIAAVILIIVGLIFGIAGSVAGGNREVARMARNGELTFDSSFFDWDFFDEDFDRLETYEEDSLYDLDELEVFNDKKEILSGDISRTELSVSDITGLQIALGGGEFEIRRSEDEHFYLEAENAEKLQVYGENSTLYLKAIRTRVHSMDTKVMLYVPDSINYEKLKLDLGAGVLRIEDAFSVKKADIDVGAGQMFLENISCDSLQMDVGAGELIGKNVTVKADAEWKVGAGHLQVDAVVEGNLNVECAMGSTELTLVGEQNDFNYEIECAAGMVQVAGSEYAGLSAERSINNSADKTMELECQMGSIEVSFIR